MGPKRGPILSWNASYKLSWSDFKAKPNNRVSAAALTASGITFGFSIQQTDDKRVISFQTEVNAQFYPEKSWFKTELADNHVLGHEQLHFDITELHTRKFRQQISKLKISQSIKNELHGLHKSINKDLETMQNTYDTETNYSRNVETQAKWQLFITQELQKLSEYKTVD
tara:strand:- start:2675 stop:3181 length:507 start_codon:yes stop_codon:yes gene_type:complete